jgi:uncharacterized paraquat-inducible protein A
MAGVDCFTGKEVKPSRLNTMFSGENIPKSIGWGLFVLSYAFLIPGLILPLYQYEAAGEVVEKTLVTTIELVYQTGGIFASLLVAFFGIAVPVVKLVLVIIAHIRKVDILSRLVVWVSKWAVVDGLIACFVMAYYSRAIIDAEAEIGSTFFILYCVLSTVGAIILHDRSTPPRLPRLSFLCNAPVCFTLLAASLALAITAMSLDTIAIGMKGIDLQPMSVFGMCVRLSTGKGADFRLLLLTISIVIIFPLFELIYNFSIFSNFKINEKIIRIMPSIQCLDVYLVTVIVMYLFLNALGLMTVEIPAAGFTVLTLSQVFCYSARYSVGGLLNTRALSAPVPTEEGKGRRGGESTVSTPVSSNNRDEHV